MKAWYVKQRKELEKVFAEAKPIVGEATTVLSPSRRYSLEIIPYDTGPSSWSYSKGVIRLTATGALISEVKRNLGDFPYSWSEYHPPGHDYLVVGEDYQGQTIIELETGTRTDYAPDSAEQGCGFCWVAHYPSPDGKFLFVDGCIWGAPYEIVLYDFSNPMTFPYQEIDRWPVWEVDGFEADGTFAWSYNVEVCTSDGRRGF